MSTITSITAPSPVADQMGNFLSSGGCSFRIWALFATGIAVKTWNADGSTQSVPMVRDSAAGYGTDVWSVFIPNITAETNYRYTISFPGGSVDRVDPFARSIVFPNWTDATQDTGDARSVVTSRDFDWGPVFSAPGWTQWVIYQIHIGTFFDPSKGGANQIDDLISQIPYLQSLGINVVQFLPFIEFSAPLSLGYDPVLPFALERDYGTPQDFMRLVQALHASNIAVLVDVVYNHIDVSAINNRIDASQPWKLKIAEDLSVNAAITSPTSGGGAGFNAQWDTDLQTAIMSALTQALDSNVDVGVIARAMQNPFEGDPFKRITYLESHDQAKFQRVPVMIDPGDPQGWFARKKSMLGFAVILTNPGIPMFFQGAELLDIRSWTPSPTATQATPTMMNFTQPMAFPKLFQFYADMVRLRINTRALCGSGLFVIEANSSTKVLAYQRWDQGGGIDDVVVIANFSDATFPSYTLGFPYSGNWNVVFNSDSNDYSDLNDFNAVDSYNTTAGPGGYDGMPYSGNIAIGPYSLIVLSR